MLKQRVIVGVLGAVVLIAVLCMDVRVISVMLSLIAVIGLSEIYNVTGMLKRQNTLCVASYIYSFITCLIVGFADNPALALGIMVFVYGFGLLVYMVFNHDMCDFSTVTELFFQMLYVTVLLAHILLVRKLSYGKYLIWFIFVTAWLSDTLAFAVGKRYGRNKLIPSVSPKKTVEGAVGGLAGSVIFNLIYALICSVGFELSVNYVAVFLISVVAGVMSQLGDLAASAIKREYNIKDYSNLLPGHGGILDRFDSVLFVAPVIYYFSAIFSVIA